MANSMASNDSDNSNVIKAKMVAFGAFPDTTPDPSGPACYEQCVPCCSEDEQNAEVKGKVRGQVYGNQQAEQD